MASHTRTCAVLTVVVALLAVATAVAGYTRYELADRSAFSNRAASVLDSEDVRAVIADHAVDGLTQGVRPDLLAVRPLLEPAVAALLDTGAFRRAFATAVAVRHDMLLHGKRSVVFDLARASGLLVEVVRGVSPRVARALPPRIAPEVLELRPQGFELTAVRFIDKLSGLWWPLLAITVAAAAALGVLAGGVRGALTYLGLAATLAGLSTAALLAGFGDFFVTHAANAANLTEEHERHAVRVVWDAFFADLRSAALLASLCGVVVATLASGVSVRGLLGKAVGLARSQATAPRLARAAVLVALGVGLVLSPTAVGRGLLVVAGVLLVLLGAAELTERSGRRLAGPTTKVATPRLIAAVTAAVAVVTVVVIVFVLPSPRAASVEAVLAPAGGCNGSRALCARTLNEVVFPSTHNSYAAADEPGWLFPNQRHGIERQLRDGIRGLLIDVHYGVRDTDSRLVRTDLAYEGSSRNKVARQLSPEALRAADALAGRVGAGNLKGPRGVYVCHTLCELGSEPLEEQLGIIRRFLDSDRGAVIVLFVEPYVRPSDFAREMRRAGLVSEAAELRRDRPLPTLGRLVRDDKRLIVFAEADGGDPPWYLPGFSFVQDTPYNASNAAELSCRRFRGSPDSPLFLVNHWIATFPPSVTRNERIGGDVLRDRLERCERERGLLPNLVAVDFYERSGVDEVAAELNRRR